MTSHVDRTPQHEDCSYSFSVFPVQGVSVKACRLLLPAMIFIASATSFAQINCPTANPAVATRLPLVCALPITAGSVASGATGAAQTQISTISNAINASIATQLTQLPIPSATSGTVRILEKDNPAGVPYSNLGPILTDRPETVGKGHIYGGFSYQRFNFNAIDGIALSSLPFAYQFSTASGTSFGTQTSNISFRLDQYVAQVTVGATKTTDLSFILPVNAVSVNVQNTNIITYAPSGAAAYSINAASPVTISGSASGIGDLQVAVKQMIHGSDGSPLAVAIGFTVRFPSGDYQNYLGSGAYGANLSGIVSYRSKSRISPHFKLAHQWNGPSPLVNTASTDGEVRLPGGTQYDVGVDAKIVKPITFAIDVLGSEFSNTSSLQSSQLTLVPAPATPGVPSILATVSQVNNTYTTVNLSTGFKYKFYKQFVLYGNVLLQLNNVGIRSDPVPLGGIAYNFGKNR